jgi:MFS family permease
LGSASGAEREQGGLIAAGVTYATGDYPSTWAWRAPSLVQGAFSLLCILVLPFVPESPRWLVRQGRADEALRALALTHADGDEGASVVREELRRIVEREEAERADGRRMGVREMVRTRSARKRVLLAVSAAVFSTIAGKEGWPSGGDGGSREAGNVAISYYLGPMLDNAGISDQNTQLQIVSLPGTGFSRSTQC